jgi:DNA-binding PadR family transcriptional regulator
LALIKRAPSYGYQLLSLLREQVVDPLLINHHHVYPILQEFTTKKILQYEWQTSNGRPRKYYRLTPKGEITLTKIILELMKVVEGTEKIIRQPSIPSTD